MRYNIIQQLGWDDTPVDGKSGVVQFAPSATIQEYPEIDLFGYMKTSSKEEGKNEKGGALTRSAVAFFNCLNASATVPAPSSFFTSESFSKIPLVTPVMV